MALFKKQVILISDPYLEEIQKTIQRTQQELNSISAKWSEVVEIKKREKVSHSVDKGSKAIYGQISSTEARERDKQWANVYKSLLVNLEKTLEEVNKQIKYLEREFGH